MHLRWQQLVEPEKSVFIEIQRMFSEETFDSSRISLDKVALNFYADTFLVKANIMPHDVHFSNGRLVKIEGACESYFLYNPITSDLSKKVIPLNRKSDTVYIANNIIGLHLTKYNVVDYVKFFGLVVSEEPFFFIDDVSEIPWTNDADDSHKQRLLGAIEAFCPISATGDINTGVTEATKRHGKTFDLSIPCIYQDACFSSRMSVAESGLIVMEEDQPLTDKSITPVKSQLPYYEINATKDYIKIMRSRMTRNKVLTLALQLFLFCSSLIVLSLFFITVLDSILLAVGSDISNKLNAWLVNKPIVLKIGVFCSAAAVIFSIYRATIFEYSEFIGRDKPHALSYMLGSFSEKLRKRYNSLLARVQAVAVLLTIGIIDLVLTASVIMFCTQNAIITLILGNQVLPIGAYPMILIDHYVNIFAIGNISSFFNIDALHNLKFTLFGQFILGFFSLLLSLVIFRWGYRFWRLSAKEKS